MYQSCTERREIEPDTAADLVRTLGSCVAPSGITWTDALGKKNHLGSEKAFDFKRRQGGLGLAGMHLGLMEYAAVREAASRTEEHAGEVLSCLLGPGCMVRIEGAERLQNGALPGLLEAIQQEGPCLCGTIGGDVEGRMVVWPPTPIGKGENALAGKHEVIAEALGYGLLPALAECSGMRFAIGPLRLKHGSCRLPEQWDDDAEAWVLTVNLRYQSRRYRVRAALFAPTGDALILYRALCLEEAA